MIFWFFISLILLVGLFLVILPFFKNSWLVLSLLIFVSLTSLTLYLTSGRYTQWKQHHSIQKKLAHTHSDIRQFGQPKTLILQLEEKVRVSPDDPKAWYFLGKLYLGIGQTSKALMVFNRAKQLDPNNMEIRFLYLSTLDLLALNAYQHKNYDLAAQYWQQILKQLPTDATEERKFILRKINQAKNNLKMSK